MVAFKLYVEGGGTSRADQAPCRRGFQTLLESAGLRGRMPRIVACGSRDEVYNDFKTALAAGGAHPILLVDAEGPASFTDPPKPWVHLKKHDGWAKPKRADDNQCHLMVQVMESWFLADRPALKAYFGRDFKEGALPAHPKAEEIPKTDVLDGLERATHTLDRDKRYHKGSHSFAVLATLDPSKVEAASPWAKRFFDCLRALAKAQ